MQKQVREDDLEDKQPDDYDKPEDGQKKELPDDDDDEPKHDPLVAEHPISNLEERVNYDDDDEPPQDDVDDLVRMTKENQFNKPCR